MSNSHCGPDIVKYFVVEPANDSVTGATGNFFVCSGTTFLKTISSCTDSVNFNNNIFYNDGSVLFNNTLTACTGIYTSILGGCSPITVTDRLILLSGLTLNSTPQDNSLTQILARDGSGLVKYINFSAITQDNTLTNILGKDSVTGEIKYRSVESIISAATSQDTFVTGFTYDDINTFTIGRNDGVDLTSTISVLSGVTYYGDGSGLYGVPVSGVTNLQTELDYKLNITNFSTYTADTKSILDTKISGATNLSSEGIFAQKNGFDLEFKGLTSTGGTVSISSNPNTVNLEVTIPTDQDKFVSGGTYNPSTLDINFVGNSTETTFDVDLTPLVASVSGDTDTFVTGFTFNNSTYDLTIKQNEGQPDLVSNLAVLASDVYVLSGVYNPSTGIVTYTNSSGGTFQVSGFTTGMTDSYTTDAYLSGTEVRFDNNIQGTNFYNVDLLPLLSGKTDNTTFNTYTANTQTILDGKIDSANNVGGANEFFKDKSGTTLNFRTLSGGSNTTISTVGDVVKVDVTIPAGTNTFVTGTTFVSNQATVTRNDGVDVLFLTGGTNVTLSNPTTNQIKVDVSVPAGANTFVTGFTYNDNNTFTIFDNDGGSFPATINQVSGLTVNGTLSATILDGNTILSGGTNLLNIFQTENIGSSNLTITDPIRSLTLDGTGFADSFIITAPGFTNPSLQVTGDRHVGIGNVADANITLKVQGDTFIDGGLTANTLNLASIPSNDNSLTQILARNSSGAVEYRDASTFSGASGSNTFVTGTTYASNQFTTTRNDGADVLKFSGGTNVTLSNPSTNQIKIDVNIPTDTNTFITGFTYNDANTFTISNNDGSNYSASINTMTGLTINGDLTVNGESVFSGTSTDVVQIYGSGTTSPIFRIQGSSGELFSVTDSLVGELFAVNDISGLPILQVYSDNRIILGDNVAPSLYTTAKVTANSGSLTSIYSVPLSAYTGAWFEYTAKGTTSLRAGNIASIFSGTSVNHNETTTTDIGDTSDLLLDVIISGTNATLTASATTSNWEIKTIIRSI